MVVEFEFVEELSEFRHRHIHQFGDGASAHFHVGGFFLQTCAVAHRAYGLSAETAQHHSVLYLVLVVAYHLEESVDAHRLMDVLPWHTMPKHVFLLLRQGIVRGENREVVVSLGSADELVFPLAHLLATPANHSALVKAEFLVGDDQTFVDAHHLAKAFTFGTGSHGGVEGEEVFARLIECHTVSFVAGREHVQVIGGRVVEQVLAVALGLTEETEHTGAVALIESGFRGVHQAVDGSFLGGDAHAVNHDVDQWRDVLVLRVLGKIVVDALDLTVDLQSAVAFLDVHLKLFAQCAVAVHHEGRQQHELGAWLLSGHAMCHILDGMFLHLHATDWRYGTSNLCIQ